MATIQGDGGSFTTLSGFNLKADGWAFDYKIETVDTSGFADGAFRTREPAVASGTFTVTGTAEGGSSTLVPAALADGSGMAEGDLGSNAKGSFTLTAESGNTIGFTGVVTGVSVDRRFDGRMEYTLTGETTGAITQSWA
jgi:hypothetical protein